MQNFVWIYFIVIILYLIVNSNKVYSELDDYLSKYETLNYDIHSINNQHIRHKRSFQPIRLNFISHNRTFNLELFQDTSIFSNNAKLTFESNNKKESLDTSHLYRGKDLETENSNVFGSIIMGIFSGRIDFSNETFYIEKYQFYFSKTNLSSSFLLPHSIIYSDKNVIYSHERLKKRFIKNEEISCGLSNSGIRDWMNKIQNSAVKSPIIQNSAYAKYSQMVNQREKRSPNTMSSNRVCPIYIRTDFKLWDYMISMTSDEVHARMEITSLVTIHVEALNKIYRETSFQYKGLGPYNGISFTLLRLQIDGACSNGSTTGFCKPNIDVGNYLNLHSLSNHDDYCIAIAMTYRDFSGGTIGLAWVGSSEGSSGGVCDRWRLYQDGNTYSNKSLNTAIFTLSNYGYRIPIQVSTLTIAHEVGHNFGSPHDSGPTCIPLLYDPNNKDGNYLMFASATKGTQKNNNVFSMCSISNITLNLDAIFNKGLNKYMCFKKDTEGFCGNQIVENVNASNYFEQCDCGFQTDCMNLNDKCCYPKDNGNPDLACTLKAGKSCSPSNGPCCNSDCTIISNSSETICKKSTECSHQSACNGIDSTCPKPLSVENLKPCNGNSQVCKDGECTGSICNKANWTACYLMSSPTDTSYDKEQLCYVSCLNPNTSKCISTGDQLKLIEPANIDLFNVLNQLNISKTGIQLSPGAPCDNYQGFCDVFRKCRKVDEDGPLNLLKKLFFSSKTADSIRDWVTQYWWAVLLIGVACIIILALFVKLCAVYTPSSNPKLKKSKNVTLPKSFSNRRRRRRSHITGVSAISDVNNMQYNNAYLPDSRKDTYM